MQGYNLDEFLQKIRIAPKWKMFLAKIFGSKIKTAHVTMYKFRGAYYVTEVNSDAKSS